jgi:hypothetical protein
MKPWYRSADVLMGLWLLACAAVLSGCSNLPSVISQSDTLYAPRAFEAGSQADAYRIAATAAKAAYATTAKQAANPIAAMVDAGIATANGVCRDWLGKVNAAELRWATGAGNISLLESAVTGILGAVGAHSSVVASYGIGATALNGYTANFHSSVLGMADYALQSKLWEIMDARATELRTESAAMSYPAALDALEGYAALCTPQAARAAARSSMASTLTRATPAGTINSFAK